MTDQLAFDFTVPQGEPAWWTLVLQDDGLASLRLTALGRDVETVHVPGGVP